MVAFVKQFFKFIVYIIFMCNALRFYLYNILIILVRKDLHFDTYFFV